jgi:hypothetical protein
VSAILSIYWLPQVALAAALSTPPLALGPSRRHWMNFQTHKPDQSRPKNSRKPIQHSPAQLEELPASLSTKTPLFSDKPIFSFGAHFVAIFVVLIK